MGFTVWDLGLRAPISASGLGAQIVRRSSDRQKEFRSSERVSNRDVVQCTCLFSRDMKRPPPCYKDVAQRVRLGELHRSDFL